MKTRFPDEFFEFNDEIQRALEKFKNIIPPQSILDGSFAASFDSALPKIDFSKEALASLSDSTKLLSAAYSKALSFSLPAIEFTQTIRTALEAYNEQLNIALPLAEISVSINDAISAALSDSMVSVADYYRPYMTEDQIEEMEETIPELTPPETRTVKPRLSFEQLRWLIGTILIPLIFYLMSGAQTQRIEDALAAHVEQSAEQHEEEIAILTEMSAASQEMNDLLQRIADSLEDADAAADLIAQDPGDLTQPDNDLSELADPIDHDGDTDGHDQNGDAEQPAAEP